MSSGDKTFGDETPTILGLAAATSWRASPPPPPDTCDTTATLTGSPVPAGSPPRPELVQLRPANDAKESNNGTSLERMATSWALRPGRLVARASGVPGY